MSYRDELTTVRDWIGAVVFFAFLAATAGIVIAGVYYLVAGAF